MDASSLPKITKITVTVDGVDHSVEFDSSGKVTCDVAFRGDEMHGFKTGALLIRGAVAEKRKRDATR